MGSWLGARSVLAMGAGGLLCWGAPPAGAQTAVPVGAEFQVNGHTTDGQHYPSVAADANGDFVVVWMSYGSSGSDSSATSIHGQRYDGAGSPVGSQFQVNTQTPGYQVQPSVAAGGDGEFVVVWEDQHPGSDSSGYSVQGQRYDGAGSPVGSQFQVNSYATGNQRLPSVAVEGDGDFVVVWTSYGSSGSDSSGDSIQGRRYDSAGSPVGSEFQVNTYTTFNQRHPSVAVTGNGDFVVVWQSVGSSGSDPSGYSIQGQRYDSAGSAVGSEFQVNTYTTFSQRLPSVAVVGDDRFVVAWQSFGSFGGDTSSYSIQGQRYDSAGSAFGSEFQVNTQTTGSQRLPSLALEGDGDFVVVWQSYGSSGSDSSSASIQGQRYGGPPKVPSLSAAGVAAGALLLLLAAGRALRPLRRSGTRW